MTADAGRAEALQLTPVSRETAETLDRLAELLRAWNRRVNLIADSTLTELWIRHFADGLQLVNIVPEANRWLDLGSGAGLPGLVIAAALQHAPGAHVHLVESNGKKAAFLREAQRTLGLPASIHAVRIETLAADSLGPIDVVTARALAPLPQLLAYAEPWLARGAKGLFLKGETAQAELTDAQAQWTLDSILVPSKTDSRGRILLIEAARRRGRPTEPTA